jgi:Ran GTPase-activating protein (RanGAP) involved in mRNA processing and transport
METASMLYRAKCQDLGTKPNDTGERRFVEQFLGDIAPKSLRFQGIGFGVNCFLLLVPILRENPQFLYLDFSMNQVGNKGADVIGFFLEQNPPAIYLNLASNAIDEMGCVYLFRSLCLNHHLTVLDMGTVDGVNRNRMNTQGCEALGSMLLCNQTLASLNLSMCGVTAAGCGAIGRALVRNTALASFDLSQNRFGTVGALALFEYERSMGCIQTLILARNAIGDEAGPRICKRMEQSRHLEAVDLSVNGFAKEFCKALLEATQSGLTVKRLGLAKNQFTAACAAYISVFLKQHPLLVFLDLSGNPMKDKGLLKLVEALKGHPGLQTIDLSRTEMTDVSGTGIAEVIRVNTALQRLYLEQNTLTDVSGVAIANALEVNRTLAVLSLADNELRDASAEALLKALAANTTLSHLDIGCNDFGCHSYVTLTKTIEQKQRLLAANVAELAQRHIKWLKEEEVRLFELRTEIRQRTSEVAAAKELSTDTRALLRQIIAEKKQETEEARARIDELDEQFAETENLRREKMVEFKALVAELEHRQGIAMGEFNNCFGRKQAAFGAVTKKRIQFEEQKSLRKRQLSEIEQRRDNAREQLRAIVEDIMRAKGLMIQEEQMEALKRQEEEAQRRRTAKGKRSKGKKKGKGEAEPEVEPDEPLPEENPTTMSGEES